MRSSDEAATAEQELYMVGAGVVRLNKFHALPGHLIGLYLYLSNSFSFHQHQALRSQSL